MGEPESPFPGRDGRRRKEDQKLIPRLVRDLSWWWDFSGWWKRVWAILICLAVVSTCGWQAGVATEFVRGQWEDVPSRVNSLEQFRDTAARPAIGSLEQLRGRVDSIADTQSSIRETMERFGERQERVIDIAEWNNCLLQVSAGQKEYQECGPDGSGR